MKATQPEQTLQSRFEEYLAERGMRRTVERAAILETARGLGNGFTAERLANAMEQGKCHVAMPTVYATLQLLTDCGILRRFHTGSGAAMYEWTLAAGVHHIHLVCTGCGKVKRLRDVELARSIRGRTFAGFTPSDFALNIYGLCKRCARLARHPQKSSDQ